MKKIKTIFLLASLLLTAGATTTFAQGTDNPYEDDDPVLGMTPRDILIKAMTGTNPLMQDVITEPPYGADGWMPIGADSLVRFAGYSFPNRFKEIDGEVYTKDENKSYIHDTEVRMSDSYANYHQPFAITVQQRRDHGRRTEPVVIYFVASGAKGFSWLSPNAGSWTEVEGNIYVQSMKEKPECATVGIKQKAVWSNIYSPYVLIHQTRREDDMVSGSFSNNIKRSEAFDALVSASACDLNADGYDEIMVFYSNKMDIFDGQTYAWVKTVDLGAINSRLADGFESKMLSYGYKTEKSGNNPNTWTSVVADFDGDGKDDILALCNQGLYWDHLTSTSPSTSEHVASTTGDVMSVFIPGGGTSIDAVTPVVNCIGSTPQLMWDAIDNGVARYYRIPEWTNSSKNNHDGFFNHDLYHYYHVTLTADAVYPNGKLLNEKPVLAVAWKYMWSDSPTESGDISYSDEDFRKGLHEWYQITSYDLTGDNSKAFTQQGHSAPSLASKVDIYQLLNKADKWGRASYFDENGTYYYHYSNNYNNTVNARASLRRPAFKTWYAGGRTMPPLLFFEGMNLYYRPNASGDLAKYDIADANALGYETGWAKYADMSGRICGPVYTYINHIDEDGAVDDRESIMVPVATRRQTGSDANRYQDKDYNVVFGHFSHYDSGNQYVTRVTANCNTLGTADQGQNTLFHYVPYVANTAKVELTGSYYTASDPMIKAVLAIPPFNTKDVVSPTGAGVSVGESSDTGSDQSGTKSESVGGGFSMDLGFYKMFKLSYGYNYKKSWANTWGESQKIKKDTEYSSTSALKDMVLFTYIPVDCFEYKVTAAPQNPSIVGKTFTFRRALNMLDGEAHVMECCWTVDDYNRYVAPAGLTAIDKSLLQHTVGQRDSYRHVNPFSSKENIAKAFPLKEGGFCAINSSVNIGTSNVSQKLSISNGHSQGTSETVSQDHKVSFGFGLEVDKVFAGGFGLNASYGYSNSWSTKTSWSETMSVGGKIPAVKDLEDSYNLYQVWYEYADEETGQNFLVMDWAVQYLTAEGRVPAVPGVLNTICPEHDGLLTPVEEGQTLSVYVYAGIYNGQVYGIPVTEEYKTPEGKLLAGVPYIFLTDGENVNFGRTVGDYDYIYDETYGYYDSDYKACYHNGLQGVLKDGGVQLTGHDYIVFTKNGLKYAPADGSVTVTKGKCFIDTTPNLQDPGTGTGPNYAAAVPIATLDGDEATGIENVEIPENVDNLDNVFNLQGLRVGSGYKGIVIVNGKKKMCK